MGSKNGWRDRELEEKSEWREEVLTSLCGIRTALVQIGLYLKPQIEMRTEIGEVNADTVRTIRREIADQEAEELERREIAVREEACGDTDKEE